MADWSIHDSYKPEPAPQSEPRVLGCLFQRQLTVPQQNQPGSFALAQSQRPAEHHRANLRLCIIPPRAVNSRRLINSLGSTLGAGRARSDLRPCARNHWSEGATGHSEESESLLFSAPSHAECWLTSVVPLQYPSTAFPTNHILGDPH